MATILSPRFACQVVPLHDPWRQDCRHYFAPTPLRGILPNVSNEPDKPVLNHGQSEPQWPWRRVRKYLLGPAIIAAVALIFITVVPETEAQYRCCTACGRWEYRTLHFGVQTAPPLVRTGPLEGWIASHEMPCSHNWGMGWQMQGARMLDGRGIAVDRGVSASEAITVMMQHYQVDDQAVAEALRVLRAGHKDDRAKTEAVVEVVNQWPTRFPQRSPSTTSTTAPAQP